MRRTAVVVAALVLLAATAPGQGKRSLVGRKLPSMTYIDTEGHQIRAADYEGSVLVLFGGIPW
ncbi:MAG: hypothetical protein ACYTDY_09765 [Planctomycetota bacterium]|jgi:hypothetical protein